MTRSMPRVLLNLLLGGAIVRILTLGAHSLWLDEGATWSWAVKDTWAATVFAEANHPPAWWVITRAWIGMFGDSEWSLRAPAALLGVLLIWLSWRLGLRLLDASEQPRRGGFLRDGDPAAGRRAALWFTAFVAGGTYFVEYAQEARMYSLLLVEAVGLSLLYLRWLDRNDRASLVGYGALAALSLYTQYFAIWPIIAHFAHAVWLHVTTRRKSEAERVNAWPLIVSMACAGLLFVPWFLWMLTEYKRIATGDPFNPFARLAYVIWRIGAGPGLVVIDRPRLEQDEMQVVSDEAGTLIVTSLLWVPVLLAGIFALRKRPGVGLFVAANTLVPIALLLLISPAFPLIHERYVLFIGPFVWLLATIGATDAKAWARPLFLASLIGLTVLGLVAWGATEAYLTPLGRGATLDGRLLPRAYGADPDHPLRALDHGHPFGKEPWREARAFVEARSNAAEGDDPGDLVLLHPWYIRLVWDYYDRHRLERLELPEELLTSEQVVERFGAALRSRTRIFLVLAHEETEDVDAYVGAISGALVRAWADENGIPKLEIVRPILFDRSWGVRVAIFNRR